MLYAVSLSLTPADTLGLALRHPVPSGAAHSLSSSLAPPACHPARARMHRAPRRPSTRGARMRISYRRLLRAKHPSAGLTRALPIPGCGALQAGCAQTAGFAHAPPITPRPAPLSTSPQMPGVFA